MTPRLGCLWEAILAGRHFERGANAAPLKAEAETSLAEADGLGKVRAHCIGALLCGVEPGTELDATMLLKGASNRALIVLVIVAILRVLPDQSIISWGVAATRFGSPVLLTSSKQQMGAILSANVRQLCAQHPIKFQLQLQSSW